MKHEITTYHTKKMLCEALKKAMKSKAFSKITVSEIISECGVNRKTFYYHFEDIFALLKWMFEEETHKVVRQFDLLVDYEEVLRFVLSYVEENDYIISCAYDSIGRDEMKQFFYKDLMDLVVSAIEAGEEKYQKTLDPDFKEYAAKFYTEAIAGMLIELVKDKDPQRRAKAESYLIRIIENALESIRLYQ